MDAPEIKINRRVKAVKMNLSTPSDMNIRKGVRPKLRVAITALMIRNWLCRRVSPTKFRIFVVNTRIGTITV
jgi:hypothetical protein